MWCPWVASGQGFIQPLASSLAMIDPCLTCSQPGCTPPAHPRIARVSLVLGGPIAMPQGSAACTTYWLCPLFLKARNGQPRLAPTPPKRDGNVPGQARGRLTAPRVRCRHRPRRRQRQRTMALAHISTRSRHARRHDRRSGRDADSDSTGRRSPCHRASSVSDSLAPPWSSGNRTMQRQGLKVTGSTLLAHHGHDDGTATGLHGGGRSMARPHHPPWPRRRPWG